MSLSDPQISQAEDLCTVCKSLDIRNWFTHPPLESIQIGSLEIIQQKKANCPLCFLIYRCFQRERADLGLPEKLDEYMIRISVGAMWRGYWEQHDFKNGKIDGIERTTRERKQVPPAFSGHDTWCMNIHSKPDLTHDFSVDYCRIAPVSQPAWSRARQQFCSRLLPPNQVDFDQIRRWQSLCQSIHQESCSRPQWLKVPPPTSFRVINVETREIVEAPDGCCYTALSYAWGGIEPQFSLTEDHLSSLPLKLPSRLQQTFEDAMIVTAQLAIKYLWVDVLCVAQTPEPNEDKTRQLEQMGAIFSAAEITILAVAAENPNSGILGLTDRQDLHETRIVDGTQIGIAYPKPSCDSEWTRWSKRAWTFQESRLPRRALAFGKSQVYWICQCDQWCEGVVLEPEFPLRSDFIHRLLPDTSRPPAYCFNLSNYDYTQNDLEFGNHALKGYVELVKVYTVRQLGHPQDGLNGIKGVLKLLQGFDPALLGTLHYGLPESCFDFALLWTSWRLSKRPTYRKLELQIPSWSWAGWFGDFGNSVLWDSSVLDIFGSQIEIVPAIKWYMVGLDGSSSAMPNHPRSSKYWNLRALTRNPDRTPSGVDPLISPAEPPAITGIAIPQPGYFLHFLTTSTRSFYIGQKIPWHEFWIQPTTQLYSLVDDHGAFSGSILVSDEVANALQKKEVPLEFIFMAYTRQFNMLVDEAARYHKNVLPNDMIACLEHYDKHVNHHEVLQVLWIDRKSEGYVERRLVAEILQNRWLAATPRTEWIILG